MSRIAYVNGRYLPHKAAAVSIDDRAFQFADGVYEVVEVSGGTLIDEAAHLARLDYSLGEIALAAPLSPAALRVVLRETILRNKVHDGMVYVQVTRGTAPRDHVFPNPAVRPTIVVTARSIDASKLQVKAEAGIRVIILPDERWKRPDVKSTSLLPNVLAKEAARLRGAAEAWLIGSDGMITEGSASNAWIIVDKNRVVTHQIDRSILRGVTRTTLLQVLADQGLALEERAFSPAEAYAAREAFVTGATTLVTPVVAIDDRPIDGGRPGPIALRLRAAFHAAAQRSPI